MTTPKAHQTNPASPPFQVSRLRQDPSSDAPREGVPAPDLAALGGDVDVDVVVERVLDDDGPRTVRVPRRHRLDALVPVVAVAAGAAEDHGALGDELGVLRQDVVVDRVLVRPRRLVHHEQPAARAAPALDVRPERPVRRLRPGPERPHEGALGPVLQGPDRVLGGLVPGGLGGGLAMKRKALVILSKH